MQSLLSEKNAKILELGNNGIQFEALRKNFAFIASLNKEYLNLSIGKGLKLYQEKDKTFIESRYMECLKKGLKTKSVET